MDLPNPNSRFARPPKPSCQVSTHLGDCLRLMSDVVPEGSVDMVLADLPYGTTQNKWDSIIPMDALWAAYWRVLKPTGVVALTASQPFTAALVMSCPDEFRHEWIWRKTRGGNFANTVREPMKEHESVLIFSRGKWTYNKRMEERRGTGSARVKSPVKLSTTSTNYGKVAPLPAAMQPELRVPSSVQEFVSERGFHPTQKPVPLMRYLVETYTNPGEMVLDNCMGSGSTGVACVQAKRRFTGIELDEGHFRTAQARLREAMGEAL